MYGYQFTLGMSGLELVEVAGEGLSEGNVGVFADRMTVSYNSVEAIEYRICSNDNGDESDTRRTVE